MSTPTGTTSLAPSETTFRVPSLDDGKHFWRIARDSGALDLNSSYAYLLFSDYFADSCIVAEENGEPIGFVMGLRPPRDPDALFVWQVAVDASHRGRGLAGRMLDALVERQSPTALEATVTPSNGASMALFRSFARRMAAECTESPYIAESHFPEPGPEAEVLFRIEPLTKNHQENQA